MKHLYKICLALGGISMILFFTNASTGPGLTFNTGYTGAPFDAGYCNNCHGGGAYTPSVSIQLLSGATPVSNYTPNASYTLSITVSTTTGNDPLYGFQVVSVRTANNANAGTWGSLTTTNYHAVTINNRTYVEHNSPLISGNINIPWTAPPSGNGSVKFYAAGNVVDGFGTFNDDNPTTNTLTIPVNPLPATWLSFDGKIQKSQVMLEWTTTNEMDNGVFILEKSNNAKEFKELTRLNAKKSIESKVAYTYSDMEIASTNYYRIKHIDISGEESIFKTIQINAPDYLQGITYIKDGQVVLLLSGAKQQSAQVNIFSIDGRQVSKQVVEIKEGANTIKISKPLNTGIYFISVKNDERIIYSDKFLSE